MKTDTDDALSLLQRANLALTEGRFDELLSHARHAAELIAADDAADVSVHMRLASMLQAAFRFSSEPDMFDRALTACIRVGNHTASPQWAIPARALAGNILMMAGRLHQAVEMCDASLALAQACALQDDRVASMGYQFRGYVLMEWNRLDEARSALLTAWRVCAESDRGVRSGVARMMAELELAVGDVAAAQQWSDQLAAIVSEPMTLRNREWLAAVRTRHGFAASRDLRALDGWQRRHDYQIPALERLDTPEITGRLHEFAHLLSMLESTRQWGSLAQLSQVIERGARPLRLGYVISALCARAVSRDALGADEEARELWLQALECGETGGYVRVYLDGSPARVRLLRCAAEHPRGAPYARRVLESAGLVHSHDALVQLTDRQRDVLRLVARGFSDREIGMETGLSVSTVKTHLRAVYARLGVRSRTAAVAKAASLSGLGPFE
jgi:LuxR family maltose regulon positive regulatory protein